MATPAKSTPTQPLLAALHLNLGTVESGVPLTTLTSFVAKSGIPLKDLYDIVIPARTLKHRREKKQSLSTDESDKLARIARILDQTVSVFGDIDRARRWLIKPIRRFEGRSPLELLRTEAGGRLIEERLVQIDEGMFI